MQNENNDEQEKQIELNIKETESITKSSKSLKSVNSTGSNDIDKLNFGSAWNELNPQQKISMGQVYGITTSNNDTLSVTLETGELLYETTEFVIIGKNGFEFPIKRIYDTNTAKTDISSIVDFLSRYGFTGLWIPYVMHQMGFCMNLSKIYEDIRSGPPGTVDDIKKRVKNLTCNYLCFGAGWRLNIPTASTAYVTLPSGRKYYTSGMNCVETATYSYTVYENHKGEDFTYKITWKIVEKDAHGKPTKLAADKFELTTKDGLLFSFRADGRLTRINDPSENNVITFNYTSDGAISEINVPYDNKMVFSYESKTNYIIPVIKQIDFKDNTDKLRSSIKYGYKSLAEEKGSINLFSLCC